jgi:LSD1 subclass zinc finger protein
MLAIGLVLGIPLLYNEALHGLADPLGTDFADVWGGAGSYALLGLSFWLVFAVPTVLAAYADSFESVRAALRRVLSAPARSEGGLAECRTCGAPVHVTSGALHVRCIYCRTDNLVDVCETRREKTEENTIIVCRDLESAILEERRVAAKGRILAATRLAKWLLLAPMSMLLGRCVAEVNEDDPTFWHRAVSSSAMRPKTEDNPPLERGRATPFAIHETFDGCDDDDCWAYYFVALERGEELRITVEEGDLRLLQIAKRRVGSWYDPTYQWIAMEPGTRAPYTGWYRVKLATARQRSASEPWLVWDAAR